MLPLECRGACDRTHTRYVPTGKRFQPDFMHVQLMRAQTAGTLPIALSELFLSTHVMTYNLPLRSITDALLKNWASLNSVERHMHAAHNPSGKSMQTDPSEAWNWILQFSMLHRCSMLQHIVRLHSHPNSSPKRCYVALTQLLPFAVSSGSAVRF